MSSLTALFVFGDENVVPQQLSTVWERFDNRSTSGGWTEQLHDPAFEGYVVGDGPLRPIDDHLGLAQSMDDHV